MRYVLLFVVVVFAPLALHAQNMRSAPPAPLPSPLGIPITTERIECGRRLFFDTKLSINGTVSCATCHDPRHGWADPFPVALGQVQVRTVNSLQRFTRPAGTRNSPTLFNVAYAFEPGRTPRLFHDGRTLGLVDQALQPIVNPIEMGNQSEEQVLNRLRRDPNYVRLFRLAYGPPGNGQNSVIDRNRFGHALASFQSTITSFGAPIDYRLAGDKNALTPKAEIGFMLFTEAKCMNCHTYPLFTNRGFFNNGMEYATTRTASDRGRAQAPGTPDNRNTIRAFKVPTLREVQTTAPYGVQGTLPTLDRVVLHYSTGGARFDGSRDPLLSRLIQPQGWNDYQRECLVEFLATAFHSPTASNDPGP